MTWSNWAGNVTCEPASFLRPVDEAGVVAAVRDGRRVRAVGAGHSFTACAATDGIMLSLDGLAGVIDHDPASGEVEVWGGTRLKALGQLLAARGLAQENLGDIDAQSIAGALATGTHGTGATLGGLATQVAALTLVSGNGDVVRLDASSPDFDAARVSLGALGVVTRVRLRAVPAFRLLAVKKKLTLDAVLGDLDRLVGAHRRFEFFWLPHADVVQAKTLDETDEPAGGQGFFKAFNDVVVENGALGLLSEVCKAAPGLSAGVTRVMGAAIGEAREVAPSHEVFATPRFVKFLEMEYAIPVAALPGVIAAMRGAIARERFAVNFPIEVRFGAGDGAWLSPAYDRATAYVAVHMYKGMPHEAYFAAMERILQDAGGRPHWGKLHTLDAAGLAARYPRWAEFQAVRRRYDPAGRFGSGHVDRVLGALG